MLYYPILSYPILLDQSLPSQPIPAHPSPSQLNSMDQFKCDPYSQKGGFPPPHTSMVSRLL